MMQKIITADDLRETKQHGVPDFPLEYYVDDTREFFNHQINWHWHSEFEIVTVSEGQAICHIEKEIVILKPGESIFINSGILHSFGSDSYAVMPNIVFTPDFIAPASSLIFRKYVAPVEQSSLMYVVFRREEKEKEQICQQIDSLCTSLSVEARNELYIHNMLSQIWQILVEQIKPELENKKPLPQNDSSWVSVPIMLQYIQTNYNSDISLQDIAEAGNVSKNTALRYFKQKIGISPVNYLIQYRISAACKLLKETSDKITHIAACVGYSNTGYFCRLFKKMTGVSPKEYRDSF